jgi:alpha-glucoside transport system permease protein
VDDRIVTALIAVIVVPVVLWGYIWVGESILERLPGKWAMRLRPYLWVAPAVLFATVFMVWPMINTIVISFMNKNSTQWVGFDNYVYFFTNPDTLGALKNNVLWLVFFTGFVVLGGLIISVLFDRIPYETLAKTAVFLPIPISAVAASIIWKFMFEYQPPGQTQTGTLNAILATVTLGPVAWTVNQSINNAALIFVGIWSWTGFAMVIISAALKGIDPELLEAARMDGASEWQVFRKVTFPLLGPTLAVVSTTMIITSLKTFDIVYTLTNGNFDTDVIANLMIKEMFTFGDFGRASAVAVVLLLAIVPVMAFNIRQFRAQESVR